VAENADATGPGSGRSPVLPPWSKRADRPAHERGELIRVTNRVPPAILVGALGAVMLLSSLTSAWRMSAPPPVRIPQPALAAPPMEASVGSLLPPAPMPGSFYERAKITIAAIVVPNQLPQAN
jgi:hypothetical protein